MAEPSNDQWQRILEFIEQWDSLPPAEIQSRLLALERETREDPAIVACLRLHFRLPVDPHSFSPGQRIGGKYTVLHKIGEGGMGVVYAAEQDLTGKEVALKLIHPGLLSKESIRRFEQEIRVLGRLEHRGIVRILDAALHEGEAHPRGILFYAMEHIRGDTIIEHARKSDLTIRERLELMIEVCEALRFAHDRRILHRDLKPANILVGSDGFPVLLDFGLAGFLERTLPASHTILEAYGVCSGTPAYMSPEQARGIPGAWQGRESVDLYSAAVILFELLTGRLPYGAAANATRDRMRKAILEEQPARLRQLNPACSERLEAILERSLEKDPLRRFQTAGALARALRQCAAEDAPVSSRPRPAPWKPAEGVLAPFTQWMMERKLGEGAVGEVWVGIHKKTRERRAFKFCSDPERLRLLKRETTLFRLLNEKLQEHPNIARLYEVSFEDEPHYLMLEHADGGDLAQWIASQGGRIPEEAALEIVAQVALGLQAAHDAGVLHRDIKPSNILIKRNAASGGVTAKLSDFGIGQVISGELLAGMTHWGFTRTVLGGEGALTGGTQMYMAPELSAGKSASARSDIYALGVVLYQLLGGDLRKPVTTDWARNVTDPLLREDLGRCFAGDPQERFSGAAQLADSLRRLPQRRAALIEEERARLEAVRMQTRRRRMRVAAVCGSIGAALLAAVAIWIQQERKAAFGRAETLIGELSELRQAARAGHSVEAEKILERSVNEFRASGRMPERLADLRSSAIASSRLPDLIPARNITFAPGLSAFACSTSREMIACTNEGPAILLHRAADGRSVGALQLPRGSPVLGEFSPLGSRFAAILNTGNERAVMLWNVQSQKLLFDRTGSYGVVRFSPDEERLAVTGDDGWTSVLDSTSGAIAHRLFAENEFSAGALAWTPDARRLAASSPGGLKVFVWDLAAPDSPPVRLFHPSGPVTSIAWDETGSVLAAGCVHGQIYLWDQREPAAEPQRIDAHEGAVTGLDFNSAHRSLLSTGEDQMMRITSLSQGTVVSGTPAIFGEGFDVRSDHPEGRTLTVWGQSGFQEFRIKEASIAFSADEGEPGSDDLAGGFSDIVMLPEGLAVELRNQRLDWHDLSGNAALGSLLAEGITDLAPGERGNSILLAGKPGLFELPFTWDELADAPRLRIGPLRALPAPEDLSCLAVKGAFYGRIFSHGRHLHTISDAGEIRIPLPALPEKMAISEDNEWLAIKDRRSSRLDVFDLPMKSSSVPAFSCPVRDFAFPAGGGVLITCHGRAVTIRSAGSWRTERIIEFGPNEVCERLAVCPGTTLLAVAVGRSVRWIDYRSGEMLLRLEPAEGGPIRGLEFSAGGQYLSVLRSDGAPHFWDLPSIRSVLKKFHLSSPFLEAAIPAESTRRRNVLNVEMQAGDVPMLSPLAGLASSVERLDEQALENPGDVRLRLRLAKASFDLGQFHRAVQHLEVLAPESRGPDGELLLALALLKDGRLTDAQEQYRLALRSVEGQPKRAPDLWHEASLLFGGSEPFSENRASTE